jgi:hypothetical protein
MKLLLLLYVPRSGSTFLASLIAKHFNQVLVLPELRLPRLLVSHDLVNSDAPRQTLLDLVSSDHQFPALGLSMAEVEACIDGMDACSAETFLLEIARAIARKKNLDPAYVLYKCGSAGRYWPELRERMPNAKFIHVYRDARAAVNSAMRSERPYHPGQKMGRGDPWGRTLAWKTFVSSMARHSAAGEPLYEIKYEELCAAPERLLQQFAADLGISRRAGDGSGFAVASSEENIHVNVDKNAMPERIDAWKDEMPVWQGLVVESLAREQLCSRHYQPYFSTRVSLPGRLLGIGYGYCYHLVAMLYFQLRRRVTRPHH